MEILYVKLTRVSAESSRPVILVLYFTLIRGVTRDAPRRTSANIQMKAPPQRLSLSLLIAERQVGVPERQPNYSQRQVCVYGFVSFFGVSIMNISYSLFRKKKKCGSPLLFLNHHRGQIGLQHKTYRITNSIVTVVSIQHCEKDLNRPGISPPSVIDFSVRSVLVGCVCLNNMQRCLK